MLDSSARRRSLLGIGTVVLALLAGGCSRDEASAPTPSPTPIARLETATMQVPRIDFCSLVPRAAISDALGGTPGSDAAYGNGDEEQLPEVGRDVVHEIGCTWDTQEGARARAWVLARPVDAAFARRILQSDRRTTGCRTVSGPAYGAPTATQLCQHADGVRRVRHSGLFGDTWLTCELSAPGAQETDLRTRTDAWCVEVVNALNTAR